jgi:hypothetical protein
MVLSVQKIVHTLEDVFYKSGEFIQPLRDQKLEQEFGSGATGLQ